jgi:predicted DNA-binding transcriptional regulator YafY
MSERPGADDQLTRILQLLPRAARRQGVTLAELAEELELQPEQVVADLTAVASRGDYHLAGSGEDTQIVIEAERVHVWTKGEFRRPSRLSPAEALALGTGLRVLAAEQQEPQRAQTLALAARLESGLAGMKREAWEEHIALGAGQGSGATRTALLEAARERRRCEIHYLKAGAAQPERRQIDPYVLVAAAGFWYALACCGRSGQVQAFRLDRILSAAPGDETFEVPADFDPAGHLHGDKVFRAAEETEVVVRYSPRIARWIVEKGPAEPRPDGSVVVRHRVADPRWLVRHVLQYGRDAEVLEPAEYRRIVADSVARLAASYGAAAGRTPQG